MGTLLQNKKRESRPLVLPVMLQGSGVSERMTRLEAVSVTAEY